MPAPFRTRSPERDKRTDEERFGAISAVIARQIEAAERERAGLERRMTAAYGAAAALLENTPAYPSRSAQDETAITRHESSAEAARHRLETLTAQLTLLRELQAAASRGGTNRA